MDKLITRRYELRLKDGTVGTIITGELITVNDCVCLDSEYKNGELFGKFGIVEEIINSVELYNFDAVYIVFYHDEDYVEIKGAFECEGRLRAVGRKRMASFAIRFERGRK